MYLSSVLVCLCRVTLRARATLLLDAEIGRMADRAARDEMAISAEANMSQRNDDIACTDAGDRRERREPLF